LINSQFTFGESSSGGISSLGLNLKAFIFQLVAFVIILLILRRYAFPKLIATLEKRRETLEQSLVQAKETEKTLKEAEKKAAELLNEARSQADELLGDASEQAKTVVISAETAGAQQAGRLIKEAEAHLEQERSRLHDQLKAELADMVADATQTVLKRKLSAPEDDKLIAESIKELE
jgi:F-type H+-transporting ATPase subunit b